MANIVTRIALEGGAAVVAALQSIGAAGQRAMQQIQQATNTVNFDRFNTHIRAAGNNLKQLGSQIGDLGGKLAAVFGITLTAGAAGFATSLLQVARAGTEAADAIDDLASDIGSTAEEVQGLQSAFAVVGVNIDGLGDKFRRLAVSTQEAWNDIRESVRNAAELVKKNQLGIEESSISLTQAQINMRKALTDPNLTSNDPEKKEQALLNLRSARLAVDRAMLAQADARKKAIDDEANSIGTLVQAVTTLSSGQQYLGQANLTAENLFKGLVAKAGDASGALQKVTGNFYDLASQTGPGLKEFTYTMADLFKALPDGALKTAIAVKAFGRGVDHDMIEALSKGRGFLIETQGELKRLGLSFDEADTKVANSFKESYNKLTNYLTKTKEQIGVIIAPALEQLVRIITNLLTENIGRIKEWAGQLAAFIKDTVTPAVVAFINVVRGVKFDDFSKSADALEMTLDQLFSVQTWQQRFEGIKQSAINTFNAIATAVSALVTVLDGLAAVINKIFGTKLTGEELGIGLLILQFTGLLQIMTLVGGAILSIGRALIALVPLAIDAVTALAPFLGWPALAIAAFAALVAAVYIYWDEIKAAIAAVTNVILDIIDSMVNAIAAKFARIKEVWDTVWNAIKGVVEYVLGANADSAGAMAAAQGGRTGAVSVESTRSGGATGSYAGGGQVRGPGTGTSDSILARVSTGEYVVRAAAVRHWGTGIMDAINAAPGYAMGGLVDALRGALAPLATPRFAAGGAVGGGLRPFTLVMPGGASYGGLYAEGGAVTQLRRAATHAQTSATGRKPSWVR